LVLADRGVAQLDRLAQRLGLLGRLDEGLAAQLVDCDPSAVAARGVAMVGEVRVRRGVDVVVEPSPDAPAVAGDAELLTWACAELVDNAVRFAVRRVEVSVTTSPATGIVAIRVGHDGDALAPEVLQAALDRGAPLEDRSGLGVGLWMADAIARLHAGSLQMAPAQDLGSAGSPGRNCAVLALPVGAQS
jgi:signal transduction histidine kinase